MDKWRLLDYNMAVNKRVWSQQLALFGGGDGYSVHRDSLR